jgi:hypothetical protein
MLGWFDLHLKGIGHGAPKAEKVFECLPEEKLMVFPKGKRPAEVITIADYCRKKGAELKRAANDSGDKKSELKNILKFSEPELKTTHKYADNSGWESFALETACGRMTPVLVRRPKDGSRDFVIATSSSGKADLVNSEYFAKLTDSGKGIVIFDAYVCGETADSDPSGTLSLYHTYSRALLWLGRTLYGEWVSDYALLVKWSRQTLNAENIELFGYKESGIAAVFAGALMNEGITVSTEKTPESFVFTDRETSHELSMGFCLPGILNWGDLDTVTPVNS